MSKQTNNPLAFPQLTYEFTRADGEGTVNVTDHERPGMTLRDYFQAHALAGIKVAPEESVDIAPQVAMLTGAIADAMLEERERNAR